MYAALQIVVTAGEDTGHLNCAETKLANQFNCWNFISTDSRNSLFSFILLHFDYWFCQVAKNYFIKPLNLPVMKKQTMLLNGEEV